jgi:TolB protein
MALAAAAVGLSGAAERSIGARPLSVGANSREWPAWSPDGRKIAYSGGNGGESRWHVYVMNVDGSGQHMLSPIEGGPSAWSPDGREITFGCSDGFFICVVDADGGNLRQLALPSLWNGGEPAWSPDGRRIAFVGSKAGGGLPAIYVMNADGSQLRRLARHALRPTWSPDGRQMAFADSGQAVICVMNADGSGRHPLYREHAIGDAPAWSPDGRAIAFVRAYGPARLDQIYVMNVNGRNQRRVTSSHGDDPAWSPDSRKIAYTNGGDIYVINADGTHRTRLT